MKHLCWFIVLLFQFFIGNTLAQTNALKFDISQDTLSNKDSVYFTIDSIILKGNKRTKNYIIFREVPFTVGEKFTPSQLTTKLELAKNQIMNTSLFLDVLVYVENLNNNIATIKIDVKERWYIFPLPYFSLADRNFSEWINDHKASLERVNYGLRFYHFNVSGRNDKLSLNLITGYSKQIQFSYSNPFSNKNLKNGFAVAFAYVNQKEINASTIGNKLNRVRLDNFIREGVTTSFTYSYRPDSKYRYYISLGYNHETVADTVIKLNPNFYPNGLNKNGYISISAMTQFYNLDYIPFPRKGFFYQLSVSNSGFTIDNNLLQIGVKTINVIPISKNMFYYTRNWGIVKLGDGSIYTNQSLLGYNNMYVRTFESYVIDGMAGFVSNNSLYQKLFKYVFKNPIKIKGHERIPFNFYAKVFGDFGYAHNRYSNISDKFSNIFLTSVGVGLDITTIYDFVFRLEYGINHTGNTAFGIRMQSEF